LPRDPHSGSRWSLAAALIPADGFYEWGKKGKEKSPYLLYALADDSVFAFAGLWDRWRNPEREVIETFSIITTSANALVSENP
jgi:putative SOS response-associated peptidase YedK